MPSADGHDVDMALSFAMAALQDRETVLSVRERSRMSRRTSAAC
jgi:hypothetical protein